MTEKTYLWDGTVTGDASLAPYDKYEFNQFVFVPFYGSSGEVYVIPGYLNDLEVIWGGQTVSAVIVKSGAALVKGILYENSEDKVINIDPITTPALNRWDRIILRIDYEEQTIRVVALKGVEAATPTLPTLTQIENVLWEADLAHVYVQQSVSYIAYTYIYNKRKFLSNVSYPSQLEFSNLVPNSEIMAFSGQQSAGVDYPEYWFPSGTPPSSVIAGVATGFRRRGKEIQFTDNTGAIVYGNLGGESPAVAFRGRIKFAANFNITVALQAVRKGGYTTFPNYKIYPYAGIGINEIEFFEIYKPDANDIEGFYYYILTPAGGVVNVDEIQLVRGYHTGFIFRQFPEVIPYRNQVTDAAWAATAKSDGTTTIDLTASFGAGVVPLGTKAIILRVRANDSGSAAAALCTLSIQGYAAPYNTIYGMLNIGRATNDAVREMRVVVPVNQSLYGGVLAAPQFRVVVDATGALTLDATLQIVGIIT